jgi:sugar phosphate isomerase/epimerase
MKERNSMIEPVSRRKFLGAAATTVAVTALPLPSSVGPFFAFGAAAGIKPMSKFNGVQIGTITYSFRNLDPGIEGVLKACVGANCSSVELMSNGIEDWCGAPKGPARGGGPGGFGGAPPANRGAAPQGAGGPPAGGPPAGGPPTGAAAAGARGDMAQRGGAPAGAGAAGARGEMPQRGARQAMSPEQQAAQEKYSAEIKAWRLNPPIDKFVQLRKMFNDAGVNIHIVKWSPARWSDEEIDYAFKTAKAMGAKAITDEFSLEAAKKLGPFAEKHGMVIAFHNHMQFATPKFEEEVLKPALASSKAVKMNFDIGHFFGSTGRHPNEIINQYKNGIYSLHLKDKTGPKTQPANANQVWGQGETPLYEVLLKVRNEKLGYPCDIELEYPIPAWSTSVKEVRTCVAYARQLLI